MRSALQSPLSGEAVGHFTNRQNGGPQDAVEENPLENPCLRYAAALSEHFTNRTRRVANVEEAAIYMHPALK